MGSTWGRGSQKAYVRGRGWQVVTRAEPREEIQVGEVREPRGFEDKGRLGSGQEQGRISVLGAHRTHDTHDALPQQPRVDVIGTLAATLEEKAGGEGQGGRAPAQAPRPVLRRPLYRLLHHDGNERDSPGRRRVQVPLQGQTRLGHPLCGEEGGEARPQRGAPSCRHPGPPHQHSAPHPAARASRLPSDGGTTTPRVLCAHSASSLGRPLPGSWMGTFRGGAEPWEEVDSKQSWRSVRTSSSSPFPNEFVIIFCCSLLI